MQRILQTKKVLQRVNAGNMVLSIANMRTKDSECNIGYWPLSTL